MNHDIVKLQNLLENAERRLVTSQRICIQQESAIVTMTEQIKRLESKNKKAEEFKSLLQHEAQKLRDRIQHWNTAKWWWKLRAVVTGKGTV